MKGNYTALKIIVYTNFISHMVQMKVITDIQRKTPHQQCFISHMVQMKGILMGLPRSLFQRFISHMVQMKVYPFLNRNPISSNFISHMVQMKGSGAFRFGSDWFLYIPHGSDESLFPLSSNLTHHNFISHMVQMKGWYVQTPSISTQTLYPTWFRWKKELEKIGKIGTEIFISHMVQMKESWDITTAASAAYFISHMVQMKATLLKSMNVYSLMLYIPHGSDER